MAVEVFETTLQKTYEWLRDIQDQLGWDDEQRAYLALRGTIHALRDRLPVDIAAHLSAQLPMLIRGIFFEGWKPAATPIKVKTPEEFIEFVNTHFRGSALAQGIDVKNVVQSVFKTIANHISPGEVEQIKQTLPEPIAKLWE